jgi:hypothetical protein
MTNLNEKSKLVVIESAGTIKELGGISGPILHPCIQKITTLETMVRNHRVVYELNPNNFDERIRLNLRNVKTVNFPAVETTTTTAKSTKTSTKTVTKTPTEVREEAEAASAKSSTGDFTKK